MINQIIDPEDLIIFVLLKDKNYVLKYLKYLKSDYFSNEAHKIILKVIAYYWKKNKELLKKEFIGVALNKFLKDKEKAKDLINHYERILSCDFNWYDNKKFIEEIIEGFIKENRTREAFLKSYDLYEKAKNKNDNSLYTNIYNIFRKIIEIDFDERYGTDYIEDTKRYEELEEIIYKSNYNEFDKKIGKGFRNKTVNVIAAPSNVGKTLFAVNLTANFFKQGYNVVYITLEIPENQIAYRLDSIFTGIKLSELKENKNKVLEKLKESLDNFKNNKIFIKEYPPNSITASDIQYFINKLKNKYDFYPDIVIVDYLSLLLPMVRINGGLYENDKRKIEDLRQLAYDLNCSVITCAQINREGYTKEDNVSMANIANSIGISMTADLIVALYRIKNQDNILGCKILKSRFSKNEENVLFNVDYEYSRITEYINISENNLIQTNKNTSSVNIENQNYLNIDI